MATRRWLVAGAALIVVAAGAGAFVATRGAREQPAPAPAPAPPPPASVDIDIRAVPAGATLLIDHHPVANPYVKSGPPDRRLHLVSARLDGRGPLTRALVFDHDVRLVLELPPLPDGGRVSPLGPGRPFGSPGYRPAQRDNASR